MGDIAKSLLEIQVEYIKKDILVLTLWLNPSEQSSSDRQSLTFLGKPRSSLHTEHLMGGCLNLSFYCWLKSCQINGALAQELKFAVGGRREFSHEPEFERAEPII